MATIAHVTCSDRVHYTRFGPKHGARRASVPFVRCCRVVLCWCLCLCTLEGQAYTDTRFAIRRSRVESVLSLFFSLFWNYTTAWRKVRNPIQLHRLRPVLDVRKLAGCFLSRVVGWVVRRTYLGYPLQGAVQTAVPMVLRQIDARIGHLRHGRQQNAHWSVGTKKEKGIIYLTIFRTFNLQMLAQFFASLLMQKLTVWLTKQLVKTTTNFARYQSPYLVEHPRICILFMGTQMAAEWGQLTRRHLSGLY